MYKLITIFALSFAVMSCGSSKTEVGDQEDPESSSPADSQITYHNQIKPIIDGKCVGCHQPGAIGGFSLVDPNNVKALAPFLLDAVSSNMMPPWPPSESCNDFEHDRSLESDQKALLVNWLSSEELLLGEPTGESESNTPASNIDFDVTLEMPEPYLPDPALPDDYRCSLLGWDRTEDVFVTATDFVAGRKDLVHHVVLYQADGSQAALYNQMDANEDGVGYTCFGGATDGNIDASYELLSAWAPGAVATGFPEGTGLKVESDAVIIMQMHYHTDPGGSDEKDLTTVKFRTVQSVETQAYQAFFTNSAWLLPGGMPIPAGESNVTHSFSQDISTELFQGAPVTIYQVLPHMHNIGKQISLEATKSNSEEVCLIDIPKWDFDWQGYYEFSNPIQLQAGDTLDLTCRWNNADHDDHHNDGEHHHPEYVEWGDGSDDEMCLAAIYFTIP